MKTMSYATTCLKKQNEPIKKKKKVKMVYAKPETWSKSFIAWHKDFIKQHCDVEKHLEQGCIHCEK